MAGHLITVCFEYLLLIVAVCWPLTVARSYSRGWNEDHAVSFSCRRQTIGCSSERTDCLLVDARRSTYHLIRPCPPPTAYHSLWLQALTSSRDTPTCRWAHGAPSRSSTCQFSEMHRRDRSFLTWRYVCAASGEAPPWLVVCPHLFHHWGTITSGFLPSGSGNSGGADEF